MYTALSLPSWLRPALIVFVAVRVAAAVWAALRNSHGDYYAAMPGAYVKAVNPTLWDSADLQGAWGYHLDTYFHGPTQYLTLYPVVYLDSYAHIAAVLLPIYAVALGVMFWATTRVAVRLSTPRIEVPLLASTFLVPGHASQVFNVLHSGFAVTNGHEHGIGFCEGWFASETTLANVRHGLCTLASHAAWFPPHIAYLAICVAIAAVYLRTHSSCRPGSYRD